MNTLKSKRHQKILEHVIKCIKNSPLCPYVDEVLLFGSCSRNEEKFSSDVDLLLSLSENVSKVNGLKKEIRLLKSSVTTDDYEDPETDLKIVVGSEWKKSSQLFYRNVRKDGVDIWH